MTVSEENAQINKLLVSLVDREAENAVVLRGLADGRERLQVAIEHLHVCVESVKAITLDIQKDQMTERVRSDKHGRRLALVEHQLTLVSASPMMTEVPDFAADPKLATDPRLKKVDDLARKQEEREIEEARKRETGIWWHRQGILWAGAAVLVVFSALVGATVVYISGHTIVPASSK